MRIAKTVMMLMMPKRMEAPLNYALSGGLIVSPVAITEAQAAVAENVAANPLGVEGLNFLALYATPLLPIVGVILGLAQLYRTINKKDGDDET